MFRVLVIDDDPQIRKAIERMLDAPEYAVSLVANGAEGVDCFRRVRHDLVITDVLMPVQEGVETIRELRLLAPSLPILAISGGWQFAGADLLDVVRRLGATEVLGKPFRVAQLRAAVARCLQHQSEAGNMAGQVIIR
jgi:DNA-binding response OmpR family regulator